MDALDKRSLHELLFGEHTGGLIALARARASQGSVSNCALSEKKKKKTTKHGTYAQKTVEIDAARIECAMEVIYRVLNRAVLGDEIDESVCGRLGTCGENQKFVSGMFVERPNDTY